MTTDDPSAAAPRKEGELGDLPSYALVDLSWPEVTRLLTRRPRLLLAVGAMEQHGRHLPLATNCRIADRLVEVISDAYGVLRAPPFWYGVTPSASRAFAGTASLRKKTLHLALNELVASWERHGVTDFVLVTAHRHEPHIDALLTALTASATLSVINLYDVDVSDLLRGPADPQHAGEIETAVMLHLDPTRVRRDEVRDFLLDASLVRKYVRGRLPAPPPGSAGAIGQPSHATAETGRRIWERYVRAAGQRIFGEPPPGGWPHDGRRGEA